MSDDISKVVETTILCLLHIVVGRSERSAVAWGLRDLTALVHIAVGLLQQSHHYILISVRISSTYLFYQKMPFVYKGLGVLLSLVRIF